MARPPTTTYGARNKLLARLGYASYQIYLDSPLWEGIRDRAWGLLGKVCMLCDGSARVLHHLGYGRAVLLGKCLKPLVPLCHSCHGKVEFDARKKKRTLIETHAAYIRLLKAKRRGQTKEEIRADKRRLGRCEKCGSKARKGMSHCYPCSRKVFTRL